jgi:hypothetical protein
VLEFPCSALEEVSQETSCWAERGVGGGRPGAGWSLTSGIWDTVGEGPAGAAVALVLTVVVTQAQFMMPSKEDDTAATAFANRGCSLASAP